MIEQTSTNEHYLLQTHEVGDLTTFGDAERGVKFVSLNLSINQSIHPSGGQTKGHWVDLGTT